MTSTNEGPNNPAGKILHIAPLICRALTSEVNAHYHMSLRLAAMSLPGQLLAAMSACDHVDPQQVATVASDVSRVFTVQLINPPANVQLSGESQILLRSWDYMLGKTAPGPSVSDDALEDYQRQVSDLLAEVTGDTSLPQELRAFIAHHLGRIFQAIVKARVLGPEVLQSIVDEALGGLARDRPNRETWDHPLVRRWRGLIEVAADLCQIGSVAVPLALVAASGLGIGGTAEPVPTTPPAVHAPTAPGPSPTQNGKASRTPVAPTDLPLGTVVTDATDPPEHP